ncbi:MAG: helix-turn-helix transcriptional regulator [Candidatus Nanoarchaeia archaeon]
MRLTWLIVLLLCMPIVHGAAVHGTIYDFSLHRVDNVKVEISTTPNQRDITENGEYSFRVESGTYMLRAEEIVDGLLMSTAQEEVEVKGDGDYVVDIILFPEIDEQVNLPEELGLDLEDDMEPINLLWIFLSIAVAVAVFCYVYRRSQKEVRESTGDITHEVIAFLKREGGRSTQKAIRKAFPHSEAKISLILTELEASGRVKKIKKGRGNVIVLQ